MKIVKQEKGLPSSIVLGPQRTGTTWLYKYIRQHPGLCTSKKVKEIYYFDENYNKGIDWYKNFFKKCTNSDKIIEVSSTYFNCLKVPKRIKNTLNRPGLICILRNPVTRSISLFKHHKKYGLLDESSKINNFEEVKHILKLSLYSRYLEKWFNYFDRNEFLFLKYEDLDNNPELFTKNLCSFLKVDYYSVPDELNKKVNPSNLPKFKSIFLLGRKITETLEKNNLHIIATFLRSKRLKKILLKRKNEQCSPVLKNKLLNYFDKEINKLEDLINISFDDWRQI